MKQFGNSKEIGHRIGLSEQAVKEHVSALLRHLAVRSRAALAEIATELKIAGRMLIPTESLGYIYEQSPVASAVVRGPEHIVVAAITEIVDASARSERATDRAPSRPSLALRTMRP